MEKRKLERLNASIFQDPTRLARLRGGRLIGTETACTLANATSTTVPRLDGDLHEC